jgi:hypothetical protein
MFIDTQLPYLLGPVILCWLVVSFVMRRRQANEPDAIKRAWMNFKLTAIGSGIVLVILWLALPSTPSLSTFGFPDGLDAVTDPRRLLRILQDFNRALVRTTEVVGWLMFLLIWVFGSALYDFLKMLTQRPSANPANSPSGPSHAVTA